MVLFQVDRTIIRRLIVGCLVALVSITLSGCAANSRSPSPTPTIFRAPTQPPAISPCAILKTPTADHTPVAYPTFVPFPTLSPNPQLVSSRSALLETGFRSQLLDREMPLLIYLPPGYFDSTRRYPVLYMLSGYAGDHREWADWGLCDAMEALVRGGYIQPMIVVMPNGGRSWWFNHANVPGSDGKPWGDYVWKEVVGIVDANYRTIPRRESRAIGGLSAGGQSALMFALTHPEIFSIAGAHSPSIRGADGSLAFFGDPEYFKQYDPVWLLENTKSWHELTFWIDVGANDTQWGQAVIRLHSLLDALGIPHEWHDDWAGSHENNYWSAHLPDYLTWYASKLAGQ